MYQEVPALPYCSQPRRKVEAEAKAVDDDEAESNDVGGGNPNTDEVDTTDLGVIGSEIDDCDGTLKQYC